jgi:glucosamine-6-phosphate deaminase
MKVVVEKDYKDLSKVAANLIQKEIEKNPNLILGLATGSTPEGMYKELIRLHKEEGLDFSKVTTFNLDEYVGIKEEHPNSYHYYMKDILFDHINIDINNTFVPDGQAENLEEYCKEYDKLIEEKGGIDLQILGIGENGHIAFNEPDEELNVGTSVVKLTESTIEANSRFFDNIEDVPKTAISMGIGSIMKAKKIILLANGKKKYQAIKKLVDGEKISTNLPASMLLLHPDITIILDEEAYRG